MLVQPRTAAVANDSAAGGESLSQQSSAGPDAAAEICASPPPSVVQNQHQQKEQERSSHRREPPPTKEGCCVGGGGGGGCWRRRRVSTSLPNSLLRQLGVAGAKEDNNCDSREQKEQQSAGGGGAGAKTGQREEQPQRQQPNGGKIGGGKQQEKETGGGGGGHQQQRMAFLGTVKETMEFLRGTIGGRSRRKGGAEFGTGTGGKDGGGGPHQRPGPCNNGNGVCPMPDNTTTMAATSTMAAANSSSSSSSCCAPAGGAKKTGGLISFSQVGSTKSARKTVQQSIDSCVADSFDEQMVDKMCALPRGMDKNEWLATNVLALFDHVNGISGTLSEVCTPATCPVMSFPGNLKASWVDERGKRHNYSAMRYIDSVMSFCEASRKNQSLFPTKYGTTFAADFESHCARMVRLLWHCLGHMFNKHWEHLGSLNLRPQFALVLAHLARTAKQYQLMQNKEMNSLADILQLVRPPQQMTTTAATNGENGQQQQRPMKRGLDETNGSNITMTTAASGGVQGRMQQKKQQQKVCTNNDGTGDGGKDATAATALAMKSGSWGGHSATVIAAQQPSLTGPSSANCQQHNCYAQTC